MCRSELRSLKDIYPQFDESVDFYAVNVNPLDSLGDAVNYRQNQGWTFPVAQPNREIQRDFNVTKHSTKVAFGKDGVIVYRDGFGGGNIGIWTQVLEDLSE